MNLKRDENQPKTGKNGAEKSKKFRLKSAKSDQKTTYYMENLKKNA